MARRTAAPSTPEHSPAGLAVLEQIKSETRRLDALRAQLTEELIELERSGAEPQRPPDEPTAHQEALRLLNGLAPSVAVAHVPGIRLREVIRQREAVDLALKMLGNRALQEKAVAGTEWLAAELPAERDRLRRLALLLVDVQRIAVERDEFRQRGRKFFLFGPPSPLAKFHLGIFGAPRPAAGDPIREFLQAAVEAKILTAAEADHER